MLSDQSGGGVGRMRKRMFLGNILQEPSDNTQRHNELHTITQTGWPDFQQESLHLIRAYWSITDELHVTDDIVYKGMIVMVPPNKHAQTDPCFTYGHSMGIVMCKQKS